MNHREIRLRVTFVDVVGDVKQLLMQILSKFFHNNRNPEMRIFVEIFNLLSKLAVQNKKVYQSFRQNYFVVWIEV